MKWSGCAFLALAFWHSLRVMAYICWISSTICLADAGGTWFHGRSGRLIGLQLGCKELREVCAIFFYVLFRVWYKNTLLWMFWGAGFVFKQDIIGLHWRLLGATDYSFYSNLTQDVILFQSGHSFIRYLSTVFFVMQRAPLSSTGLMQNDLLLLQKDAICFSNMFFVD